MRSSNPAFRAAALAALALGLSVGAHAQTAPSGGFISGDKPIEIESDKLEVRDQDNIAIFSGNVSMIQDDFVLRTVRMVVHYEDNGESSGTTSLSGDSTEVERIEAEGKVFVRSGGQEATGDNGSFEMKTGIMVLSGDEVVLTEGQNVVVGCKLTMNTVSGESQVDSCAKQGGRRVQMLLQPQSSSSSSAGN